MRSFLNNTAANANATQARDLHIAEPAPNARAAKSVATIRPE
ncbi:MAG: hypothetical protein U0Q16_16685 [Bryobacteraceae bacterium]